MKILLATTNKGKIAEFKNILNSHKDLEILTLDNFNICEDVEEVGNSFEQNSILKANFYNKIAKIPTIAEDSGLEIKALNNEPGIYSARYGGINITDKDRVDLILDKMKHIEQKLRVAKFVSVICSVGFNKDFFLSKGILLGEIYHKAEGKNGFGYDPIFFIPKKNKTLAMMTEEQKNKISHRRLAIEKFLDDYYKNKKTQ
ncbi:MAG: non-canonical purine NTP pyrophosphatase, RdgB/HAM1 family [Chloroflexi bacterium]|jgi:XTP/dITP diphosphohydrolase|nr:non-canonical purine NTP pyrophosphatase, RdgB/HAM1 family [Chloroflexota bacterium]|tara:strand:- start:1411 stop:2013 length:603 start_codon:yes stop_codon:yes gene_type:complete